MRNRLVKEAITREREAFISSLDSDAICALATSYHPDRRACRLFQRTTHGSFNICFFVQFDASVAGDKLDRWVVRIPFPGRVPWIDEKVDSEVATMKYVAEHTTIPIPKVHAWSRTAQSPIGKAFIIIEYIEGQPLTALGFPQDKRWKHKKLKEGENPFAKYRYRSRDRARIHNQIADLYIQLRGLEFPRIGALGMPPDDSSSQDIDIRHRPLPIEVLLQQVEGLNPTEFFPEGKIFDTSSQYVEALAKLAFNLLSKTEDPDLDDYCFLRRLFNEQTRLGDAEHEPRKVVYAYTEFCKFVCGGRARAEAKAAEEARGGPRRFPLSSERIKSWGTKDETGPFPLMHGDLSLHGGNLLWDQDLNLVAVIDWEWSHTVPPHCFIPPAWLHGSYPEPVYRTNDESYRMEFATLYNKSIGDRDYKYPNPSPLLEEWDPLKYDDRHIVTLMLLYPATINDVYWRRLDYSIYPSDLGLKPTKGEPSPEEKRVDSLFRDSAETSDLVKRKMADEQRFAQKYEDSLKENGGKSRECRCQCCQEWEENFEILRDELPMFVVSWLGSSSSVGSSQWCSSVYSSGSEYDDETGSDFSEGKDGTSKMPI